MRGRFRLAAFLRFFLGEIYDHSDFKLNCHRFAFVFKLYFPFSSSNEFQNIQLTGSK